MPRPRKRGRNKGKRIPWKIIRKHNRRRPASSLEKKVHLWLDEDGITYTKEKSVGRHLHVDVFLEPNICIELNGCHWHGCMICNKDLSKEQKEAHLKDAKRYFSIRRMGFDVVVFWECEVNKYSDRVRAQLRTLARKK
jgi:G:T-mismatch repair DNA endonuclease (very short patch repair protein)